MERKALITKSIRGSVKAQADTTARKQNRRREIEANRQGDALKRGKIARYGKDTISHPPIEPTASKLNWARKPWHQKVISKVKGFLSGR